MPITITRSATPLVLIGTSFNGLSLPSFPPTNMQSLAMATGIGTNTQSSALVMGTGTSTNITEANIMLVVAIGTSAPTSVTVTFLVANDNGGTPNYIQDGPGISVPVSTTSAFYGYRYDPPDACQNVIINFNVVGTSGTNLAYAFAEASTLSVS